MSPALFYFLWGLTQSTAMQVIFHGFFYTCYYLEWDIIERYKSIEEPWPWKDKENKDEWNRLLKRTAVVYSFNMFILSPLSYSLSYLFG